MIGAEQEHRAARSVAPPPGMLPESLLRELEEVRGSEVLCGRDVDLDGALAEAERDCDDLGQRLIAHVFHLVGEAAHVRDNGEDPASAYSRAARACEAALRVARSSKGEKDAEERLAIARYGLSASLRALGELSDDAEASIRLYARAVVIGEEMVRAVSVDEAPRKWGVAQSDLADALCKQASLLKEENESLPLYRRAIEVGEAAQRILKKRFFGNRRERHEWSELQFCLAKSYLEIAISIDGEETRDLLERSLVSYRSSLRNMDRKGFPMKRITALEGLGRVLMLLGDLRNGKYGRRDFDMAAHAFRMACAASRREWKPMSLAMNRTRLGACYRARAGVSSRFIARFFLSASAEAYRASLRLFTPDDTPVSWMENQERLGSCLLELSGYFGGAKSRRLIVRSQEAFKTAMHIDEAENFPHMRATIQNRLAVAHRKLAKAGPKSEAMDHYNRAREACEAAIEVFDKMGTAEERIMNRYYLSTLFSEMARFVEDKEEALELHDRAIEICEEGLSMRDGDVEVSQYDELLDNLKFLRQRTLFQKSG